MKSINTDRAPKAVGPYSQAIRADNFLFISAQIPLVPLTGELTVPDINKQIVQVLENIKGILESQSLTLKDVVKTTVFLKNIADFPTINSVYAQYFTEPFPARACIEVSNLPKGALVAVEAVACYK